MALSEGPGEGGRPAVVEASARQRADRPGRNRLRGRLQWHFPGTERSYGRVVRIHHLPARLGLRPCADPHPVFPSPSFWEEGIPRGVLLHRHVRLLLRCGHHAPQDRVGAFLACHPRNPSPGSYGAPRT